jgi:hypothetical protein
MLMEANPLPTCADQSFLGPSGGQAADHAVSWLMPSRCEPRNSGQSFADASHVQPISRTRIEVIRVMAEGTGQRVWACSPEFKQELTRPREHRGDPSHNVEDGIGDTRGADTVVAADYAFVFRFFGNSLQDGTRAECIG